MLAAVREASQHETMLRHVRLHLEGEFPAGEDDYDEVTAALNARLVGLAGELMRQLTRDDAASSFREAASGLAHMLAEIDAADQHLQQHLTAEAKEARLAGRQAFADFKERLFQKLQLAIEESAWDDADKSFQCLKAAAMGSAEEQTSVEERLKGQSLVSGCLIGCSEGAGQSMIAAIIALHCCHHSPPEHPIYDGFYVSLLV